MNKNFNSIINSRLKPVHSDASLQLFQQVSQYIDGSMSQISILEKEDKIKQLISHFLKIKSFFDTEINNENVRKVIRENLSKEYELFIANEKKEDVLSDDLVIKKKYQDLKEKNQEKEQDNDQ